MKESDKDMLNSIQRDMSLLGFSDKLQYFSGLIIALGMAIGDLETSIQELNNSLKKYGNVTRGE